MRTPKARKFGVPVGKSIPSYRDMETCDIRDYYCSTGFFADYLKMKKKKIDEFRISFETVGFLKTDVSVTFFCSPF